MRARQSPMETVTLIIPLKVTTNINPSNSSGVTAGAITGEKSAVTAVAVIE